MNDRFKFRAWHKPTKKMFEVHCFADKEVFENAIDGVGASPTNPANIDDCVLMQCTGIKDEDGKLIYEGDIVECFFDYFDGNFSNKRVVGPVVWYAASWEVKEKGNYWDLVDAGFDEKKLQSDYVKIIGNIHENPELLEDK